MLVEQCRWYQPWPLLAGMHVIAALIWMQATLLILPLVLNALQ